MIALSALVGIVLGAAASAANESLGGPDTVGVCHATGSEEQPYVFLVVDRDGYEHGHHRHHESDYFVDASANGCRDDVFVPPTANETVPDNSTEGENSTETPQTPEDPNGTVPEEGNSSEPAANGTPEPEANESAPSEPQAPPPGEVTVAQTVGQDDFEVVLEIVVTGVGEGPAQNVSLTDALPDVRRPWYMGGTDAARWCTLDGLNLTCWFGDLDPNATRTLVLSAYTDRMPCGQPLTNTAVVAADSDLEERDDRSSASIAARSC